MKKYLLFIISMLCAVTGAWADGATYSTSENILTITTNGDDNLTGISVLPDLNYGATIVVTGPLSQEGITKILNKYKDTYEFTYDFSGATIDVSTITDLSINNTGDYRVKKFIFSASALPSIDVLDGVHNPYNTFYAIALDAENKNAYLYVSSGTQLSLITELTDTYKNGTIYICGNPDNNFKSSLTSAGFKVESYSQTSNAPYTVNGCTVTINMAKAEEGQTLADLIALAKTAMTTADPTQTNICTLTVQGELTNNDLIALGGANMTGATRIDLSDITMGTGVTIDNIQLPASLTSLILPKGLTVSVGLKSKLTAATNLKYAYSPSTGTKGVSPDTETISVADYVWVNSTGGLDLALTNEATLNDSKYVKVASDVALSETDITFSGRLPNVKYFDMRNANMDASLAAASFGSPNSSEYRIILPDNWNTEQMSAFASHLGDVFWKMAAIYSYSGTTLKIYEATDTKYMSDALSNHRIVVDGTTAIEVVGPTLGTQLLEALNGADSDVKTITISASSINNLTFDNDNITTLNVTGLNLNTPELNVDGCAVLKNLNVTGSTISSVDASATSLEAVNLNGSTISNNVDLSGSGLKTLTTNSETWIKGDLHLESTASFTSFASTAKLGTNSSSNGNIYLNHSGVSTVDLQSVQFQNTSSNIHIDSNVGEGDTPLTNLNADGKLTIYIPTGFTRTRLHPYSSETLDDNIAELAASSTFEDGCNPKCRIEYDADTHVATVYCYTPGHFKTLMENDNNYGKFVDGAIFTFDASCKLNADDLAALAGKDGYGNFNWNYVDLYNLPASYTDGDNTYYYDDTKSGTTTTNGIISEAINTLRTNNWQYKGLLLPKTAKNIGTTLIQDRTEDTKKLATCSQFIAYSGAIGTSALTAAYIYKAADDWGITHAERLGKMKEVMDLHPEIKNTTNNWSVSTNSPTPIDMSILPTSVTIEGNTVNTSKLETVNNDMVAGTGIPSIYAYPAYVNVMYTVATSTGIGKTPNLEILKVTGPVNATDIESVNQFTAGPRVLDLSATTGGITKAMLESITNANIEYIILPAGMTKDVVCEAKYKDALKSGELKAVISSDGTNLVAYVNTPGSLAEARYLATGGTVDANTGLITPTQTGMQSVTLAGNLNAADIAANTAGKKVDADGHWGNGSGNASSIALSSEQGTVTKIDLEDAVFPQYTDMNFSYAGLASISDVTLPTSDSMNKIPADCFRGITSIHELCIPYYYEYIENAAFYLAELSHITTTDKNGALVDNGKNTFTFSKNLKEIGQAPSPAITGEGDNSYPTPLAEPVFFSYAIHNLTDVYVLRTGYEDETFSPTKCYRGAFGAGPTYGWGGFDGGNIYCREKYKNGTQLFTILNFPDEASVGNDETKYNAMEKCYTDPTKVYTKKDQTGALDANGESIPWPTFSELGRSYNQAVRGLIWEDWTYTTEKQATGDIEGGVITATPGNPSDVSSKQNTEHYDFTDYVGWHEFVLSKATYVAPDEKVVDEEIIRNFELDDWYTFCIPFDMTESEVLDLMGIPASHDNIINQFNGTNVEGTSYMPEIRTLKQVNRTQDSDSQGTVKLVLTRNLGNRNQSSDNYYDWIPNTTSGTAGDGAYQPNVANTGDTRGEKIVLRGGHPYMIRPYKPVTDPATSIGNLGKYVLKRYSFPMAASCIYREGCYTELGGNLTKEKSKFASPYEGHIVLASYKKGESTTAATYEEDNKTINYLYKFIGQFWQQQLPSFSYYMTGHKWYYFKKVQSDANYDKYKWNQYVCIINVNSTQDADHSIKPNETGVDSKGHAVFNQSLYIEYTSGHDDAFTSANGAPRFMIVMEGDENGIDGNTTAIDRIDGVDITPMNSRIYGMNGQYVGNSLEGLPQGIYIVNGKKVFVK